MAPLPRKRWGCGRGRGPWVLPSAGAATALAALQEARWMSSSVERSTSLSFFCPSASSFHRPLPGHVQERNIRVAELGLPQSASFAGSSFSRRGGGAFSGGSAPVSMWHGASVQRNAVFSTFVGEVVASPNIFAGEVAVVVILSSLFERGESWARRQFASMGEETWFRLSDCKETGGKILDALFKEVTCLGFIGLLLFLVTKSGAADTLAESLLGPLSGKVEYPLAETFETVHIMIFLLLTVLLFQAAAVFVVSRQVAACWTGYESTRAFGELDACLESKCAEAGYLERVSDPSAPRGTQLLLKKTFVYGDSVQDRVQLRQLPLHKLIMWRAIRHEFLFPSSRAGTDTQEILKVPDPGLFSFEEYLRTRLGTTVLALVEVDIGSWFLALLLILPLTYICSSLQFDQVLALQCSLSWLLAAAALALTLILEEDTYELTPGVPEDMRQTLRMFSGTSFQMLRRCRLPGGKQRSLAGRRFRPGLADAEEKGQNAKLSLPPRFAAGCQQQGPLAEATGWPAPETYRRLLRLLAFFQAVCVTSLIVTYLSEPLESWLDIGLYCLAWAEWPLMLFQLVPVLLRRLTLRTSIEDQKDAAVIRKISLKSKQGLIRDLRRLVQLTSFQRHARLNCKLWASYACFRGKSCWSENQAEAARNLGMQKFNSLPQADRLEIWALFAGWDAENDGVADTQEIVEMFAMMGYPEGKEEAAESLICLVDDVGNKELTWPKFKSLFGLALSEQGCSDEVKEGLGCIFTTCAQEGASRVSVFELSEGLLKVPIFLSPDDAANLLHSYFGQSKPSITKAEFVEWVIAGGEAQGAEDE